MARSLRLSDNQTEKAIITIAIIIEKSIITEFVLWHKSSFLSVVEHASICLTRFNVCAIYSNTLTLSCLESVQRGPQLVKEIKRLVVRNNSASVSADFMALYKCCYYYYKEADRQSAVCSFVRLTSVVLL